MGKISLFLRMKLEENYSIVDSKTISIHAWTQFFLVIRSFIVIVSDTLCSCKNAICKILHADLLLTRQPKHFPCY